MNAYASSSDNPYARKYLTKSRRSSDGCSFLDTKSYLMEPKTKKFKRTPNKQQCLNMESCNYFSDNNEIHNDFNEFYEFDDRIQSVEVENYNYLHYSENQNISDENSGFLDDSLEEYSIDFIDETDNSIIDSLASAQYQDPPLFNGTLFDSHFMSQPSKSKRKQGIVGRPTLSSPQRLLVPDNVYCHESIIEKCFTDNNHRVKQSRTVNKKSFDGDDPCVRVNNRSRPRILLKPQMADYQYEPQYIYCPLEQDAKDVAQRQVANREFARNLVARAQRQGTVIDKNKIPLSVLEQEPVGALYHGTLSPDQLIEVAEIKDSHQLVSQPFTTTISIADLRKTSPVNVTKRSDHEISTAVRLTASDILKQKWRAASRH